MDSVRDSAATAPKWCAAAGLIKEGVTGGGDLRAKRGGRVFPREITDRIVAPHLPTDREGSTESKFERVIELNCRSRADLVRARQKG